MEPQPPRFPVFAGVSVGWGSQCFPVGNSTYMRGVSLIFGGRSLFGERELPQGWRENQFLERLPIPVDE